MTQGKNKGTQKDSVCHMGEVNNNVSGAWWGGEPSEVNKHTGWDVAEEGAMVASD